MDVCRALTLRLHAGAAPHTRRLNPLDVRVLTGGAFDPALQAGAKMSRGLRASTPLSAISEAGLYALVMRADTPAARVFQDWVTREVLPSIRKTGSYALADHGREAMPLPMDIAEALGLAVGQALAPVLEALAAILAGQQAAGVFPAMAAGAALGSRWSLTESRWCREGLPGL